MLARSSAGIVWSSVGTIILILTYISATLIQFANPLPPEGVFFLLILGGIPAALCLLLGLRRGYRTRRDLATTTSAPTYFPGIRIAIIGLGLLLVGIFISIGSIARSRTRNVQLITEAQSAVEKVLLAADRIPTDMRERLGSFKELTGEGYGGAVWNIQSYDYLMADRDAHFGNATIPVRFYVTEGNITNPGNQTIVVLKVERDQQLYLIEAPLPKVPTEGLRIMVSHPDLKH